MKTIQMPIIQGYQTLACRIINNKEEHSVMMIPISEQEENEIDKGGELSVKRHNLEFNIETKDIYCYGKINFDNGSEDMDTLSEFNWLDFMTERGKSIPANYNHKNHTCRTDTDRVKYFDTTRPELVAQYAHGLLGKPERVLIFRYIVYEHRKVK